MGHENHETIQISKSDVQEIKNSVKRLEEGLMGTLVDGESKVGLFERVRLNEGDIINLKDKFHKVDELNKSVEKIYRWKYWIMGGLIACVFFIDKIFEFIAYNIFSFFKK